VVAIDNIIAEAKPPMIPDTLKILRQDPTCIAPLFKPLTDAGFHDFNWVGSGTNAFFVAPADNDNIVFRVSSEDTPRRSDRPFFLCSAYEKSVKSSSGTIKLEVLLSGKKAITAEDKTFLFDEMKNAGWRTELIANKNSFWRDVVAISLRDKGGRLKTVPIISDPSAINHLYSAWPVSKELNDGTLQPPNMNSCSSNYITLQDQAAAYNSIIAGDPRLKSLIPDFIEFPETEIISSLSQSIPAIS